MRSLLGVAALVAVLTLNLHAALAYPAAAPTMQSGPVTADLPRAEPGKEELILATTTSTQDSGLLDVLVPTFERMTGYRVKTIAVGTGAALALGARGEADVVLAHAPDAERDWMAAGNGTERLLVMHNDFIIIGPRDDPAQVRGQTSAAATLRRIASTASSFVSRGDESGTHLLERALWRSTDINPRGQPWYTESGQGMGATLNIADDRDAYMVTDRATYLARRSSLRLDVLVEGEPSLLNIYHVMPVNPSKSNLINAAGGGAFAAFMVRPDTQDTIARFGVDQYGQPLFFPDAGKHDEDVGR